MNIYYNPEHFGLEIVSEEDTGGDYEFDKVVVWRDLASGAMYWAADSGCSCPIPFEDYTSVESLTPMGGDFGTFLSGRSDLSVSGKFDLKRAASGRG